MGICNQFGTLIPAAGLASNADPLIIILLACLCGYGPMENSYRGGIWTEWKDGTIIYKLDNELSDVRFYTAPTNSHINNTVLTRKV